MFRICILLAWVSASVVCSGANIWDKSNDFQPWRACWRLKCSRNNGVLELTDIGKDSSIVANGVNVDPAKVNRLSIRYRATGIASKTTGQLYFSGGKHPRFSDDKKWKLPSLNNDGNWHTLTLDVDQCMKNPDAWAKFGIVTQLRLDLMDQPGGKIEIGMIAFSEKSKVREGIWNKDNDFQPWKACWRLTCTRNNGFLKLSDIGKDSSIIARNLKLHNNGFNRIDIRYRANGTPKSTRGQIYFTGQANNRFTDKNSIKLPSLVSDGQWHTMSVDISRNAVDFVSWQNTAVIKDLRLDMMDQAGGEIEIEYILLYKLTVADPEEAAWQKITPQFLPPAQPEPPYFGGKMIRFSGKFDPNSPKHFFFRKKFTLSEKPVKAYLQFLADDAAEVFINGQVAASCETWREAKVVDISNLLKTGANLLAVNHWNHHGSTGLLIELYCEFKDGSFVRINSDKSFVSSDTVLAGWNTLLDYDDSSWQMPEEQPVPPGGPWISRVSYIDFRLPPQKLNSFSSDQQQLNAGSLFTGRVVFDGKKPEQLPSFDLVFSDINGQRIIAETINKYAFKAINENQWELIFSSPLPRYIRSQKLHLALHFVSGLSLDKVPEMTLDFVNNSPLLAAPRSKIVATSSGPQLEINGKTDFTFVSFANIKHPKIPAGQDFSHAPIRVISPGTSWIGIDKIDFYRLDKAAEAELRRYPNAMLLVQITCYPSRDWGMANRDELAMDSNGRLFHETANWMGQNRVALSFASQKGRDELAKMVEQMIEYVENSHWRHRVVGYRIAGGHTSEWIAWGHDRKLFFDYSPVNREAFRKYLQKNYPDVKNTEIPSPAERLARKNDEALLDPALHTRSIAYNYFESECVTDMIITLCQAAKKACRNRVVVGTYYGYHMNVTASDFQFTGHLALKRLIDSRSVDFIMSPPSYAFRQVGDTMGDMKPFQTIANNNIMPVIEDDTRTHNTADYCRYYQALNPAQSVALLQRNMAMALCRNQMVLLYALMRGTELHFPELSDPAKMIQRTGSHCLASGVARNAEIALVVSENTLKHMPFERRRFHTRRVQVYEQGTPRKTQEGLTRLGGTLIAGSVPTVSRIGAPVDYILAEDLKDHPGDYKLYIFLNAFYSDPDFLQAVEKLRQKKCVLAWFYAPGYIFEKNCGIEYMKKLTGFDFGKSDEPMIMKFDLPDNETVGCGNEPVSPVFYVKSSPGVTPLAPYKNSSLTGFAEKNNGKAIDIYIGSWHLPVSLGKYLIKKAGVHSYIDTADPIEANGNLFTLHTRFAGKKVVSLPRKTDVLDVFNKKIIARKTDSFSFEAPLHSTWLFYFGDDAEKLLQKLNDPKAD